MFYATVIGCSTPKLMKWVPELHPYLDTLISVRVLPSEHYSLTELTGFAYQLACRAPRLQWLEAPGILEEPLLCRDQIKQLRARLTAE